MHLRVLAVDPVPLVGPGHPDLLPPTTGMEGGRVFLHAGRVHWCTAELAGEPRWVRMRLGHWSLDADGQPRRRGTLVASSGDHTGEDARAACWSPMPFWNPETGHWELFYVTYRAKPDTPDCWNTNHDGRVWRAISRVAGPDGLDGPYDDAGVLLAPGPDSQPWEGHQGVDSFFLYRAADGGLVALHGSAKTQIVPCPFWGVGLSTATSFAGPWTRQPHGNPLPFDPVFAENPVVERLADGRYLALIDGNGRIGWSLSRDGRAWDPAQWLQIPDTAHRWWRHLRTPLGLIPRPDGTHDLWFTAISDTWCPLARMQVALEPQPH
jgi:hypothetical protein